MPRTQHSTSTRARHKKWLKRATGYRGRRKTVFKLAKEAALKAGQYAYRDRRKKKSEFRNLWNIKINAGARANNTTYSLLIAGMKKNNIELDRKVLAELAQTKPEIFSRVVEEASK